MASGQDVDFAALQKAADSFDSSANQAKSIMSTVEQEIAPLRGAGYQGDQATAFNQVLNTIISNAETARNALTQLGELVNSANTKYKAANQQVADNFNSVQSSMSSNPSPVAARLG